MVPEPRTLGGSSPAQEAGELLSRPEVRAVFVCEDEQLVGVVTRGTLVRDVVAAGRDPAKIPVREIAGARCNAVWRRTSRHLWTRTPGRCTRRAWRNVAPRRHGLRFAKPS